MRVEACGRTDVGLRRANNEDAFLVSCGGRLLALADGMGGAASGEVASAIFIDSVRERIASGVPEGEEDAEALVQDIFLSANARIWKAAQSNPQHRDMGCTGEIIAFAGRGYAVGHVGDSRIYLFRGGRLRQVTKDHSFVQQQVDEGLITPEQARTHAFRHMILRAVGIHEAVAVDLIRGRAQQGDLFLLCSDGLSDMVEDGAIETALAAGGSLEEQAERLVRLACEAGGHDNVTVVLGLVREVG